MPAKPSRHRRSPAAAPRAPVVKLYDESNWPSPMGYVEPADRKWILFFDADGNASFWPKRRESGAVYGPSLGTKSGYRKSSGSTGKNQ